MRRSGSSPSSPTVRTGRSSPAGSEAQPLMDESLVSSPGSRPETVGVTVPTPAGEPLPPPEDDPRRFQRAVFYEVLIRGFFDSNDDGSGDLPGLIAKLDYLQWLGVDCLWLLPFYPSPLRDGGYDISDYFTLLPHYRTPGGPGHPAE